MAALLALSLFLAVAATVYAWLWAHRSGRKYPKVIAWRFEDGRMTPCGWLMPDGQIWRRIEE